MSSLFQCLLDVFYHLGRVFEQHGIKLDDDQAVRSLFQDSYERKVVKPLPISKASNCDKQSKNRDLVKVHDLEMGSNAINLLK